jgi:heptosyltransferase-1
LVQVPAQCHAVDRSRWVMCSAIDSPLIRRDEAPQFFPIEFTKTISKAVVAGLHSPYVLFFHSTAREAKRWPNENWISLGRALSSRGFQVILPWGSPSERAISELLAAQIPGSLVPPAFSIEQAFSVINDAALTVGVDTGLTHLSAVLNKPTVEIYCDSPRWKTEGYWSDQIRNIGDLQHPPAVEEVLHAALGLL